MICSKESGNSVGTPESVSPMKAMELIKLREKIDIPVIPYGGSAPAMTALLGGYIARWNKHTRLSHI
jgi:tripartite-type tricarboxylate transporter receptor subunit TctC